MCKTTGSSVLYFLYVISAFVFQNVINISSDVPTVYANLIYGCAIPWMTVEIEAMKHNVVIIPRSETVCRKTLYFLCSVI